MSIREILWTAAIEIERPLTALPQPFCVAREKATSKGYRSEGRQRRGQDHCILHYCLRGEGSIFHRNCEYAIRPGHGFLCAVNDPDFVYTYPPSATEPWEFIWFGFREGNSRSIVSDMTSRFGPVFPLRREARITKRLLAFERFAGARRVLSPFAGAALVQDMVCALGEPATRGQEERPNSVLVRKAQQLARETATAELTVNALSARLNVSREHLSRVFRQELGIAVSTYIQRQRVLLACQLLRDTNLSVKEIAARLRYDSPANFARAFKRYVRTNPTEFRAFGLMPS